MKTRPHGLSALKKLKIGTDAVPHHGAHPQTFQSVAEPMSAHRRHLPRHVRFNVTSYSVPRMSARELSVLPIAALMIWLAVSFGLRPLVRITEALLARSDRDLAPLAAPHLPPDLAPLVRALNALMFRMDSIITAQRNFIADAAHELLTPLTALRLQTQLLVRADSGGRRRECRHGPRP